MHIFIILKSYNIFLYLSSFPTLILNLIYPISGENLLYMLVQPQWVGDMVCDVARHVNPENLFVQNPYSFLLSKEKEGERYFLSPTKKRVLYV